MPPSKSAKAVEVHGVSKKSKKVNTFLATHLEFSEVAKTHELYKGFPVRTYWNPRGFEEYVVCGRDSILAWPVSYKDGLPPTKSPESKPHGMKFRPSVAELKEQESDKDRVDVEDALDGMETTEEEPGEEESLKV